MMPVMAHNKRRSLMFILILAMVVLFNLLFSSPPRKKQQQQELSGVTSFRQHDAVVVVDKNKTSSNKRDDDFDFERERQQELDVVAADALEHVLARRQAYEDAGDFERWKFRGLGYLYTHKNMVLQASLGGSSSSSSTGSSSNSGGDDSSPLLQSGRNIVEIHDVYHQKELHRQDYECELLVMWVRVNGPEIFAGTARPITTHGKQSDNTNSHPYCYWEFPFMLRESGSYHVTVKLLLWNPNTSVQSFYGSNVIKTPDGTRIDGATKGMQCPFQFGGPASVSFDMNTNTSDEKYPFHQGIHGFKLYDPVKSCCEICSKLLPHCQHWATPPDHFNASFTRNGCELYYQDPINMIPPSKLLPNRTTTTTTTTASSRRSIGTLSITSSTTSSPENSALHAHRHRRRLHAAVPQIHGDPHSNPTTYFLGCGWSYAYTLDYPCLSGALDDRVYMTNPNFTFTAPTATTTKTTTAAAVTATVQMGLDDDNTKLPQLPLCTLEHEALDSHDGRWVRAPFPNNTACPNAMMVDMDFTSKFNITQFDATHPHCWHRDDFHNIGYRCFEMNCQFITKESKWISHVHEEQEFYGVWKPYACDYVEFTDEQLQTCITNKNISSIEIKGASIAEFLRQYLGVRLKNMVMYKNSQSGGGVENSRGRSIILSTLKLLHHMNEPDDVMAKAIVEEAKKTPAIEMQDVYWVSGFFLSSERCDHCHLSRMNMMNHLTNKTLEKFGHKMINAFDMSAAFTYDTATQFDGMHIIGPPMKMIITKLFHHMCKDEVSGSRLGLFV